MGCMELVSVILPVYNGEKYLKECIDSILASTYTNLEIILVDDGSTDTSGAICDAYASHDSRVTVIHQKNSGAASARNAGLARARGTYVGFVDADDTVSPVFYEEMVGAIESFHADIAACEYRHQREEVAVSVIPEKRNLTCAAAFDQQMAILTCAPSIRDLTWTGPFIWDKLYRRAKIQRGFQAEYRMCEDLRFNWDYLQTCETMVLVHTGLYFYRIHAQSITGLYRQKKSDVANGIANAALWALIARSSLISDPALKEYLEARAAYTAHGALWRIYCAHAEGNHTQHIAEERQLIHDHCSKLLRDKETYNLRVRAVVWLCSHAFPLWKTAARLSAKL